MDLPVVVARQARFLGRWIFFVLSLVSLVYLAAGIIGTEIAYGSWLSQAYGWWVALAFVLLQVGLGNRLRGLLGGGLGTTGEIGDGLVSFIVGFWLTSGVAIVLAGTGLVNGLGVGAYTLLALAWGVNWKALRWSDLQARVLPRFEPGWWRAWTVILVVGVAASPYLLQTLIPNSDWDSASTHLPLAQWIQDQGLRTIALEYSNLIIPGSVHLIYAMFLAVGAEQAIVPLSFVVALMTCAGAGVIARRFWGPVAGGWALAIALSTNLILELGLDARIDGFLAFFCVMAALGVMTWLMDDQQGGWLILAGMGMGLALGAKYTAVFPLVLWGAPVVWVLVRSRGVRGTTSWRTALMVFVVLAIPSSYWYLANGARFGDPLYPRFGGELMRGSSGDLVPVQKAVADMLATADRADGHASLLARVELRQASYQPPRSLFHLRSVFLEPDRHSRKAGHTLSPLLLLFVFLPLYRRDKPARLLWWMGLSVAVAVGYQTYLVRYGLVFYPLMATGSGAVLAAVRHRVWRVCWAVILVASLAANLTFEWQQVERHRVGEWLSGQEARLDWLRKVGYNNSTEMPEMIHQIVAASDGGSLPRDGKILMLGEAKFHLLGFDAQPDISRLAQPWLAYLARSQGDLDRVRDELWSDGIRYLLINLGYFEWVMSNLQVDAEILAFSVSQLEVFVRSHGELSIAGEESVLIRLKPPTSN